MTKDNERILIKEFYRKADAKIHVAVGGVTILGRFIKEAERRERNPGTGTPRLSWISANQEAEQLLGYLQEAVEATKKIIELIEKKVEEGGDDEQRRS